MKKTDGEFDPREEKFQLGCVGCEEDATTSCHASPHAVRVLMALLTAALG